MVHAQADELFHVHYFLSFNLLFDILIFLINVGRSHSVLEALIPDLSRYHLQHLSL